MFEGNFRKHATTSYKIDKGYKMVTKKISDGASKGWGFRKKRFIFLSKQKFSTLKSRTVIGSRNIGLKQKEKDYNSERKDNSIGATRQRDFANVSFGPAKAKRYGLFLDEGDDKRYWFAKNSL